MGSCEIRFGQKQDYHVLNPLPSLYPNQLAETKAVKDVDVYPSAPYIRSEDSAWERRGS